MKAHAHPLCNGPPLVRARGLSKATRKGARFPRSHPRGTGGRTSQEPKTTTQAPPIGCILGDLRPYTPGLGYPPKGTRPYTPRGATEQVVGPEAGWTKHVPPRRPQSTCSTPLPLSASPGNPTPPLTLTLQPRNAYECRRPGAAGAITAPWRSSTVAARTISWSVLPHGMPTVRRRPPTHCALRGWLPIHETRMGAPGQGGVRGGVGWGWGSGHA